MRGVVQESEWNPHATADDIFHVGDRICVHLGVPWAYFGNAQRMQALLLETDALGSALVTPGRRPPVIERRQSVVTLPPTGPRDSFVVTQPTGKQSFTAMFL